MITILRLTSDEIKEAVRQYVEKYGYKCRNVHVREFHVIDVAIDTCDKTEEDNGHAINQSDK